MPNTLLDLTLTELAVLREAINDGMRWPFPRVANNVGVRLLSRLPIPEQQPDLESDDAEAVCSDELTEIEAQTVLAAINGFTRYGQNGARVCDGIRRRLECEMGL